MIASSPRCLGIGLFYNDDDMVRDALEHLLENNHDLIIWDHGSTDRTAAILDEYNEHFVERLFLPREFDFYRLFETVSRHILDKYAGQYDWISFPESDEILEGPDRSKSYYEHAREVLDSPYDWVQFNNIVYWFTEEDDDAIASPVERIRRYCIWKDCPPRVYAWRASAMNIRAFNHNPAEGEKYPTHFNTCHYQMRSEQQMRKRIRDRMGLRRGSANFHFDYMSRNASGLFLRPELLHYDDRVTDLDLTEVFKWREVYGTHQKLCEQLDKEAAATTSTMQG
jgi:glycosyltransferase involved in cell wall biosynthesis